MACTSSVKLASSINSISSSRDGTLYRPRGNHESVIVCQCGSQRRVTRRIALTRPEFAILDAAAARAGISIEAFLEQILRAWIGDREKPGADNGRDKRC